MALDRSRHLAVDALIEKLKAMIERRAKQIESYGSARSSWSVREEFQQDKLWNGGGFTNEDRKRADQVLSSYQSEIGQMKAEEDEMWRAIADLLKL